MLKSKNMKIVIFLALAMVFAFWVKKQFFSKEVVSFSHGPFEIKMERSTSRQLNWNNGGFYDQVLIEYSVLHKGKVVAFPSSLQSNTGFSHLWRAYILKDAPTPTIVAGSQSVFMVMAKGDTYEVRPLDIQSSDFIKFQWLDEENGQPGPAFELFMGGEKTSMKHPDTLHGGKYLMISQKHVLHVPTMEHFSFNIDNSMQPDNYDKSGDAIAFSPDKSIIVFPGNFQTWNSQEKPKYHNALMSYDFRNDSVKTLPYSKTDTRLYRNEDLTLSWFNTYFSWDTSGTKTMLTYNKPEKLQPWQGYFNQNSFYLYPTDTLMFDVFKKFIIDHMKWTPQAVLKEEYHEYTGRVLQLGIEKSILNLIGRENEVHLSPELYEEEKDSTFVLIKEIGLAFNKLLKTGKYQEYFTSIPEFEEY
jgi:hypothetical protein